MAYDPLQLAAGDLKHAITIEAPSTVRDAAGQRSQTWTAILNTRASIRALTMRESVQDDQITSQVTHIVTLRYPGSSIRITPECRLVSGIQTYQIQAVDNVLDRNRVLRLQCLAVDEPSVKTVATSDGAPVVLSATDILYALIWG